MYSNYTSKCASNWEWKWQKTISIVNADLVVYMYVREFWQQDEIFWRHLLISGFSVATNPTSSPIRTWSSQKRQAKSISVSLKLHLKMCIKWWVTTSKIYLHCECRLSRLCVCQGILTTRQDFLKTPYNVFSKKKKRTFERHGPT